MDFPAVFVLRGFLKRKELNELRSFVDSEEPMRMSGNMAMVRSPNELNIASGLDKRMAILAGFPKSSVEHGHFNIYEPGSAMSVHQDNNHDQSDGSHRVASFVIFIRGQEEGLVGGHTVFPFLNSSN